MITFCFHGQITTKNLLGRNSSGKHLLRATSYVWDFLYRQNSLKKLFDLMLLFFTHESLTLLFLNGERHIHMFVNFPICISLHSDPSEMRTLNSHDAVYCLKTFTL